MEEGSEPDNELPEVSQSSIRDQNDEVEHQVFDWPEQEEVPQPGFENLLNDALNELDRREFARASREIIDQIPAREVEDAGSVRGTSVRTEIQDPGIM